MEDDRLYRFILGKHKRHEKWDNCERSLSWNGLVTLLTNHKIGEKDGSCIVPGVFTGSKRTKQAVERVDFLMLDSDTGVTFDHLVSKLREKGWKAIVSSTHSHMTTETEVRLSNWNKWVSKTGSDDAERYLLEHGMVPEVASGAMAGTIRWEKAGDPSQAYLTLAHEPCPKFRVILPLARPWLISNFESRAAGDAAWKSYVVKTAAALSFQHDQSCIDTSRLFFLPRRPADIEPQSAVLDGAFLHPANLDDGVDDEDAIGELIHRAQRRGEKVIYRGFDLTKWLLKYGTRFELATALRDRGRAEFTGRNEDGKQHLVCVDEGEHTRGGTDSATFCSNASDARNGVRGFNYHCLHAHCKDKDRAHWVSRLLEEGWLELADLKDEDYLLPVDETDEKAQEVAKIADSLDFDRVNAGMKTAKERGELEALCDEIKALAFTAEDRSLLVNAYQQSMKRITGNRPSIADARRRLRPLADSSWLSLIQVDHDFRVMATVDNAIVVLTHDPVWKGVIGFDVFRQQVALRRDIPVHGEGSLENDFEVAQPWQDHFTTAVRRYLQRAMVLVSQEDTERAIQAVSRECPFNSLTDQLGALEWDCQPRLDRWLVTYLFAADNQYTRDVGKFALLSAVARAYEPGCKVDTMLVLEGNQGGGKSTVPAILGGSYFTDSLPPLDQDQVRLSMALRGKWIIEHAEMKGIRKALVEEVKAFLTRQEEHYTPKYGRATVTEPRTCIFIGTTNPEGEGYLTDPTGNRRFLPVKVGDELDLDGLARDRDQLLAEAVFRQRVGGESWYGDREWQKKFAAPEQMARTVEDSWQERIKSWLDGTDLGLTTEEGERVYRDPVQQASGWEIAEGAIGLSIERFTRREQMKISGVMFSLGWLKHKDSVNRNLWVRPPDPDEDHGL